MRCSSPSTEPTRLLQLRETRRAADAKQLAEFRPYLTGAVLNGTAGEHVDIHLQLFADNAKDVEICLLNDNVDFEVSESPHFRGRPARAGRDAELPVRAATSGACCRSTTLDDLRGACRAAPADLSGPQRAAGAGCARCWRDDAGPHEQRPSSAGCWRVARRQSASHGRWRSARARRIHRLAHRREPPTRRRRSSAARTLPDPSGSRRPSEAVARPPAGASISGPPGARPASRRCRSCPRCDEELGKPVNVGSSASASIRRRHARIRRQATRSPIRCSWRGMGGTERRAQLRQQRRRPAVHRADRRRRAGAQDGSRPRSKFAELRDMATVALANWSPPRPSRRMLRRTDAILSLANLRADLTAQCRQLSAKAQISMAKKLLLLNGPNLNLLGTREPRSTARRRWPTSKALPRPRPKQAAASALAASRATTKAH